jgi:hypothetical protein
MTTVATAALLVAIGLLVLAAAACAVQMTSVKDPRARRLARLYLEPLAVWCMAAVVVHALAIVAAGDLVALKLVLPVGIGVAAFLLRWADEPHEPAAEAAPLADATAPSRAAATPAATAPSRAQATPAATAPSRAQATPAATAPSRAAATSAAPAPSRAATPAAAPRRRRAPWSRPPAPAPAAEDQRAGAAPSDAARVPVRPAAGSLWSRG